MKPSFFRSTNKNPRQADPKDLNELHIEYGNEKANISEHIEPFLKWHIPLPMHHNTGYAVMYEGLLSAFRDDAFKMLEIGICDWRFPFSSAKIYLRYFHNVEYWGMDLFLSKGLEGRMEEIKELNALGGNVAYGDQSDAVCVREICEEITKDGRLIKVVIDDGSHQADHIWTSLETIWPFLEPGAWYLIEDLASGWPYPLGSMSFGDDTQDIWNTFYQIVNQLNPRSLRFDIRDNSGNIIKPIEYKKSIVTSPRAEDLMKRILPETSTVFFRPGRDGANWVGGFKKNELSKM